MEPIRGDSFGQALLARYEGRSSVIVIERDDGFAEVDASTDYFADAEADPHWAWIAERVTGRVLDIGAGAGRAALTLQRAGHDVVALDVSPAAVEICRRRGVTSTFEGTVADLAAAEPPPQPFDAFVAIGNNLGLMGSRAGAGPFLDALRALGAPGARLVGTMLDPYRTDDPDHLAYHEANRRAGRLGGEIRIRVRYRRTATDWFGLLWASADELAAIAADNGWAVTDTTGGESPLYAAELNWLGDRA
jgi:SAM-dependent methyltransferase